MPGGMNCGSLPNMSTKKSKRARGDLPPLPLTSTNILSQTPSAPASASLSTSASSPEVRPPRHKLKQEVGKLKFGSIMIHTMSLSMMIVCQEIFANTVAVDLFSLLLAKIVSNIQFDFRCVWNFELLLLKYGSSEDKVLGDMADMMKKKFDNYWSSFSMILSFAIMLDPRYKFEIIRHCFEKLDVESAPSKSLHVKEEFQKLYQEYDTRTNETSRNQAMDHGDSKGFATLYDHSRRKSEFDVYFDETLECHNNLDVLAWWKTNAYKFPLLARMAKDVLAIPITTVASKSTFSMGSKVITKCRSSLRKETAKALLTTRSWLYGLDIEEDSEDNLEERLEIHLSSLQLHNDNEEDDSYMED